MVPAQGTPAAPLVPTPVATPAPVGGAPPVTVTGRRTAVGSASLETMPQGDLDNFTDWSSPATPTWSNVASNGLPVRSITSTASTAVRPGPSCLATHPLACARRVSRDSQNSSSSHSISNKINVTCYLSTTTASFTPSLRSRNVCLDSGASHDLWNSRDDFITYQDLSGSGRFVSLADDSKVPIMGIGTIQVCLAGRVIRLHRVYHVPRLDLPLIAIRVHRRRAKGCSFIADFTGCYFTFPTFVISVDDETDVTLPFESCSLSATPDYSDTLPHSNRGQRRRKAQAKRVAYLNAAIFARKVSNVILKSPVATPVSHKLKSAVHPPLPNRYVPCSSGPGKLRLSAPELHQHFGCRSMDYNILPHLGTGLEVCKSESVPLSIGDVINIKRGKRGGKIDRFPLRNHTVGADLGYGDGKSPGGFKYCLFLTCLGTKATFVYGLRDLKGETISDAFWMYAIDAGGFPKRLRCDFEKRFIQGAVSRLLRSHGVRIGASPPHRQSQNGAVERQWQTACNMARSFLATARLPKRYWFWGLREAVSCMNMLPVKSGPASEDLGEFHPYKASELDSDPTPLVRFATTPPVVTPPVPTKTKNRSLTRFERYSESALKLSTPHELFYGIAHDYRVLFPFGSLRYFRRPVLSTGQKISNFHSQSRAGITLGQSDHSNAMMFWDPLTSRFCSSADYYLDGEKTLPDAFPELIYNGFFTSRKVSGLRAPKEPFPPGAPVFALVDNKLYSGTVTSVPTPTSHWYHVKPGDSTTLFLVDPMSLSSPDDPLLPVDSYTTEFEHPLPTWVTNNSKVSLSVDGCLRAGTLCLTDGRGSSGDDRFIGSTRKRVVELSGLTWYQCEVGVGTLVTVPE